MKYLRIPLFVMAAELALLTIAAPVNGQARVVVNVPFKFRVGDRPLPAGQYVVEPMADPTMLRISDGAGHVSVTLSNSALKPAKTYATVTFNRYGEMYFLSEVHWADTGVSRQLLRSKLEVEMARNIDPERVVATSKK